MASNKTKQALLNIFGGVAKAAVASTATKKKPQKTSDGRLAGLQKQPAKKPCGACGGKK